LAVHLLCTIIVSSMQFSLSTYLLKIQKHLPYAQNVFIFKGDYKATSYTSYDKLGEKSCHQRFQLRTVFWM